MPKPDVYSQMRDASITLPEASPPAAAYVMSAQSGALVFVSGHIAKKNGKVWAGKLGDNMSTEEGVEAARAVAIDLLSTLHAHVGDLNRVKRIFKIVALINSTSTFTDQHLVTNGASDLMVRIFGDRGEHARSAFGVSQIPLGACVEIEMIAEIE
jgi:enamine deaminase RidA (YjgF/YER057c/UK114 family)